jgi:hypothetical protein
MCIEEQQMMEVMTSSEAYLQTNLQFAQGERSLYSKPKLLLLEMFPGRIIQPIRSLAMMCLEESGAKVLRVQHRRWK